MAEVILMPRLSDTMTEGVIAAWHKKIGDTVKKGDLLAEIETDKATMELESYKDGTLLHTGGDKGVKIQVDDLLAIIGKPGEDISSLLKNQQPATSNKQPETSNKQQAISHQPPVTSNQQPDIDVSKMDEVVLMPRLSDTMEEGVIASWHKNVGDTVKKGEVLAEIETDKATMDLESYKNGTLLHIGAQKGEKIPVNGLLCIIGEKGKVDVEAIVAAIKEGMSTESGVRSQQAVGSQQPATSIQQPVTSNQQPVTSNQQPVTSNQQPVTISENGRVKASPLAKKLATDKGIDIKNISGTGDGGRIIKADIDNYKQSATGGPQTVTKETATTPVFTGSSSEGYTDIPNSQIRSIIAKRLAESKFSAPHFYLTMEINMDNAIAARTQLNEISPVKISFNDLVVKAAALALRQHPAVNASWLGDKIRRYSHIHIGIAVAIEDGLIVPVIRFADQKTLPQIAAESKELAGKAKNKKLQPPEFTGNTFTISNLGMMDIDEFTAIINPPDSCIMAVGRIKETVVKKGEGFAVSNVMKITLSCDHRSVDGATGAAFLQTFKKFLENPITMFF
ncbi:MAG: pyruvate dehydrogenase complex dihydrolipoamide acetyltransferase [Chitinophagaceae bacterium]|nr:pyruvate dehydrogenase complex dihydrolipoamide acetyltransferase [Chitinophagaceae bacterium]